MNNELIEKYHTLINLLDDRETVARVVGADKKYIQETNRLHKVKLELKNEISEHYEKIRFGRVGSYETLTEFISRMENTLDVDSEGNVINEYYKLGIGAIDDEFFNGQGVFSNSFIAIGADSGVGKTTMALHIIGSLAIQDVKAQFYSFEMGDRQFYNEISTKAKNKLKKLIESDYAHNLSFDFHSRDIDDLANSIQMRHEDGVKAFVIDSYLSIYSGHDEFKKMKMVVDMLATLKKELGILIILIGQVSKNDSFNGTFEFHGGNILKYESDVSIFIKMLEGEEDTTKRHIHCDKNRIFEENSKKGIVTDYNRETHAIEKISDFKNYGGVDKDGKELKSFKKGFGSRS